ncbi:DUF4236 domain-containing protein [Lysobacter niastensis]|uniref:DUF4236 domain-containing protein n=1 Tax=Lysobacter niastensis TaxID=380629 RepID=A0ABS0B720_9GAMM|nr:DUF4236 domain-containing protein [Lysobacter niastensis]MBF6024821.1 DUF4236 domain-containing protein [Lysobacter niastensis]
MGIRSRKSFKLAPGVRMNLSGGGTSFSFGPRGASVSVGKRGVYGSVGIPGTGLSMRQKLSTGGGTPHSHSAAQPAQMISLPVSVGVRDDGEVFFQDQAGAPLAERLVRIAKQQHGDAIRKLIQSKCDEINAQIEAVGELHRDTPSPDYRPAFIGREFESPRPVQPKPKAPSFLGKFFKRTRERIDAENQQINRHYEDLVAQWESAATDHRQAEHARRVLIEEQIYVGTKAMELHLEATLQNIAWPRETLISAEVEAGGLDVFADVDLPEIGDMPDKVAGVPARGMKLSVKDMSPTQVQRLYMRHIHAIVFRIVGEIFAALPKAERVVISGYSQRSDKATGRIADEYLLSLIATRQEWTEIELSPSALECIDVVDAIARFDLRRAMSKSGVFKAIAPFLPEEVMKASPAQYNAINQ